MEPVTHFLTGACLGRAGFNRKTAYATLAMTLAAEAPDIDVVWALRGPVAGLEHHRGITHTFLGAPLVALVITGLVWIWHRYRKKHARPSPSLPPPRWFLIWLFSLIAVLSHLLLDFTNDYGLRPFFPFNPRWYSWDIVFIFEPLMFLALLGALIMPWLFGLTDREIGAARKPFRGRGWAIAALLFIVCLYAVRNAEHARAINLVRAARFSEPVSRLAADPYAINPFHWRAIIETPDFYQTASVDTRSDSVDTGSENIHYKPPVTPAVQAGKRSWLGQVYLDWSQFPLVSDLGNQPAPNAPNIENLRNPPAGWTTVEFQDLRFTNLDIPLNGRRSYPLTGWVYVSAGREVEAMVMGGREQK